MHLHRVALVFTAICFVGCVRGYLDPSVTPIARAIDDTLCAAVPVFATDHEAKLEAGLVCTGAAGVVQAILDTFASPQNMSSGARRHIPIRARHPKLGNVCIGHISDTYADRVQKALDALPPGTWADLTK